MKKHIKNTILATAAGAATFTAAGVSASADDVTIKAGDTLSQLAVDNNTTADALADLNGIANKDLIFAGDTLKVDGSAAKKSATPAVAAPAASTTPAAQAATSQAVEAQSATTSESTAPAAAQQPASASTAASQQTAAATPSTASVDASYSAGADGSIQAMVDSMNAKRAALGLAPVRYDASLAATAQARAQEAAANDGLPSGHFQQVAGPEVVAIGFDPSSVVDAWYNETNMITNGTPSHRLWVTNASFSRVGFAVVGSTIVGIAG
ncbi:CAP domain-containing protein [Convivina intestini]|uniref:Uncharacterized protein YkwD n=1 Tax=Convivina intestini TaxID=1505726 RepID=A0A2U1DBE6_9LACO|nr:CAP domain-containing protein [Convivina intestini]PVY84988.1 uncharacterized protein YkwD [Convivina intestini]CAH1853324.1 hypothetical protein R077811_00660 [Convivina intestini]CAH1856657.1 hypothetical protein R078131_01443 [Convivina intestini]SDB89594.1 Uncharacterized conserved protein YkwD, contains CAP (CSP/antigen 5/PR1) domain [Leuconostocaceae bacterium R-53105]